MRCALCVVFQLWSQRRHAGTRHMQFSSGWIEVKANVICICSYLCEIDSGRSVVLGSFPWNLCRERWRERCMAMRIRRSNARHVLWVIKNRLLCCSHPSIQDDLFVYLVPHQFRWKSSCRGISLTRATTIGESGLEFCSHLPPSFWP